MKKKRSKPSKPASLPSSFLDLYSSMEPITQEIIDYFVSTGGKLSDILEMKKMGYMYNRDRNSFVAPLEFEFE